MSKRAIIYSRVSSDDVKNGKEGRNLEEQVNMCREYAERKGYSIVEILAEDDRGASGASLNLDQLNRVLSMARSGEYDVLVVREMDRLARGLAKQLIIEEELKQSGIGIEYVLATYENNPEGDLTKNIRAVIAEYERYKINERMSRGRRVKAKQGNIIAPKNAPYGFDLCKEENRTWLTINQKEAEIVRLIFNWCAKGMTIHGIQRELTKLAIPTPADSYSPESYRKRRGRGEWARSTIHMILNNECYTGAWYYGRRSPTSPNSRLMKKNPRETWIEVEVPIIIPPDLWQTTRQILENNKLRVGSNVKVEYLLRGHLICGDCKRRMVATSNIRKDKVYSYYVCRSEKIIGEIHIDYSYSSKLVDEIAWVWIKQLLLDPQALGEGLAAYKREQEISTEPTNQHINAIEGLLTEKRESLTRLLDLYLSGEFQKEMLMEKKTNLEKEIGVLERERAALRASLETQSLSEEQEQSLIEFTSRISESLDTSDANFETRREIIETLGVEVILAYEDGQKTMRVKCILGFDYFVISPIILGKLAHEKDHCEWQ